MIIIKFESNRDKIKNLSLSEYLIETFLYLVDFINKITNNLSKVHFSIKIMFKCFKYVDEEREIYLKSIHPACDVVATSHFGLI